MRAEKPRAGACASSTRRRDATERRAGLSFPQASQTPSLTLKRSNSESRPAGQSRLTSSGGCGPMSRCEEYMPHSPHLSQPAPSSLSAPASGADASCLMESYRQYADMRRLEQMPRHPPVPMPRPRASTAVRTCPRNKRTRERRRRHKRCATHLRRLQRRENKGRRVTLADKGHRLLWTR